MIDNVRCEVLDASYDPVNPVSARRALTLFLKGKASILREHPTLSINTTNDLFSVPTLILLHRMVSRKAKGNAQLNQPNLFIRDKFTCQYCNRHRTELQNGEFLTRDHVHPRSLGGKDVWDNVVAACNKCNNKKADRLLQDVGFKLQREPYIPSRYEIKSKKHKKQTSALFES
jgi:5-methylcytosine-specific restriction endonuclease McrA